MNGKIAVVLILAFAIAAGAGLFYLEQFHWYDITEEASGTVTLTAPDGTTQALPVMALTEAQGASSPLKYRACFEIDATPTALAERFAPYEGAVPTVAPLTFPCFHAEAIASALAGGDARAFMGEENVTYGIDRVVVVGENGVGYAWHQINACGERVFDGEPPPPGCPPPPPDQTPQ